MTAREMLEKEMGSTWRSRPESEYVDDLWDAAERVIDRLQQQIVTQAKMLREREEQVRDLEVTSQFGIADSKTMMRERYRDRLDRMVAAIVASNTHEEEWAMDKTAAYAAKFLAAIDAAVVAYDP